MYREGLPEIQMHRECVLTSRLSGETYCPFIALFTPESGGVVKMLVGSPL